MLAGRQAIISETCEIDAVILLASALVQGGVRRIVFEGFTQVPPAVAVLVGKSLAPHPRPGNASIPVYILTERRDRNRGSSNTELHSIRCQGPRPKPKTAQQPCKASLLRHSAFPASQR